jgi:hypothetical protein
LAVSDQAVSDISYVSQCISVQSSHMFECSLKAISNLYGARMYYLSL